MNCSSCFSSHNLSFFHRNPQIERNPRTDWTSVIKYHAKLRNDEAILSTYTQMESLGITPDSTALPLVFKACVKLRHVDFGRSIHFRIQSTDLMKDVRVGTAVVDFYTKFGFLEEARNVFDVMSERDVALWNAMMHGYSASGEYNEAMFLFMEMQNEGLRPNSRSVVALLSTCGEVLDERSVKAVHCYCLRNGFFDSDIHVGTALIGFYLNYNVEVSRLVFDSMVSRNTICWNAMINAYLEIGDPRNALDLFIGMLENGIVFDSVTLLIVVQACAGLAYLELGMQVHQIVIKSGFCNDLFIVNALLNMYSEFGSLQLASELFRSIPRKDLALWNSMISTYIKHGCNDEARSLFVNMHRSDIEEDARTIVIISTLCTDMDDGLKTGKSLHGHTIKRGMKMDVHIGNCFLGMYAELNCLESARKVFRSIRNVDIISYNTMISALASNKFKTEALDLFLVMQASETEPNAHTLVSILPICEDEGYLDAGRSIHGLAIKHRADVDISLNTALIDMYMKCGDVSTARKLFECCVDRDLVSWNALIAGYIKHNRAEDALMLFRRMISEVQPSSVTVLSILSSCIELSNLPLGKCLHAFMTRRKSSMGLELSAANTLITMYGRCGSIQIAEKIFRTLSNRNIVSWNAIITGYGINGRGEDAVNTFFAMLESGIQPNRTTFLSVLSACSHSGMVEKGLKIFNSMVHDFNMRPEMAHYGCVVDLLGRAGHLDEAMEFINQMPIEPDVSVWRALLNACRGHCEPRMAKNAVLKLIDLEPENAGNYVLLSNVCAEANLWTEVGKIRAWLREKGLTKPLGMSWTIVRGEIHSFVASDTSHPFSDRIYEILNLLTSSIQENGHLVD